MLIKFDLTKDYPKTIKILTITTSYFLLLSSVAILPKA